jgi:hypothetical protein
MIDYGRINDSVKIVPGMIDDETEGAIAEVGEGVYGFGTIGMAQIDNGAFNDLVEEAWTMLGADLRGSFSKDDAYPMRRQNGSLFIAFPESGTS